MHFPLCYYKNTIKLILRICILDPSRNTAKTTLNSFSGLQKFKNMGVTVLDVATQTFRGVGRYSLIGHMIPSDGTGKWTTGSKRSSSFKNNFYCHEFLMVLSGSFPGYIQLRNLWSVVSMLSQGHRCSIYVIYIYIF